MSASILYYYPALISRFDSIKEVFVEVGFTALISALKEFLP